jgi:hypothetical protein
MDGIVRLIRLITSFLRAIMHPKLERMWINQPEPWKMNHHLHGTLVLADATSFSSMTRVWFTPGSKVNVEFMDISWNCLSKGWPWHLTPDYEDRCAECGHDAQLCECGANPIEEECKHCGFLVCACDPRLKAEAYDVLQTDRWRSTSVAKVVPVPAIPPSGEFHEWGTCKECRSPCSAEGCTKDANHKP